MTVQKLKQELTELKKSLNVKKAKPWDCKSLMLQFKDERLHREIFKKICKVKGQYYEEPGPIELNYANFCNLSREAREFLALSDGEKAEAVENEFPPEQYTDEEAEELRRQLIAKINGVGSRLRHDNTTA